MCDVKFTLQPFPFVSNNASTLLQGTHAPRQHAIDELGGPNPACDRITATNPSWLGPERFIARQAREIEMKMRRDASSQHREELDYIDRNMGSRARKYGGDAGVLQDHYNLTVAILERRNSLTEEETTAYAQRYTDEFELNKARMNGRYCSGCMQRDAKLTLFLLQALLSGSSAPSHVIGAVILIQQRLRDRINDIARTADARPIQC